MNRFLARVKAYLDRGDTPPAPERTAGLAELFPPGPGPSSSAPTALDTLDGHYGDARALVDAGRGRHAVDTETRLMSAVPAAGPPLATGPDIRPAINVPLLRQVLEHITTYPKVWDQATWWDSNGCGTSGCLAGWAVYFAVSGVRIDDDDEVRDRGHVIGHVRSVAQNELGLTDEQANEIFYGKNTLRTLWTLAAQYTRGEITVPDELPDGS